MSTIFNISSVLSAISSLETQLAALKAQLGVAPASAAAASVSSAASASGKKAKKEKKVKDPNAPKRDRSSWGLFTDRVRAVLQANGYTGKSVATECVQFCSDLKKANPDFSAWKDADILSRRSAWTKPEVSIQEAAGKSKRKDKTSSSSSSVVSEGEAHDGGAIQATASVVSASSSVKEKKPRKVSAAPAAPASVVSVSSSVKEKKPRKPSATAVTAALIPLPPSPPSSVVPTVPLKKIIISKVKYLVHLDTGHAWHYAEDENGKPAKGVWAGLFSAPSISGAGQKIDAKVDSSVPNPNEDE